ncbi:MAG: hypothetical protein IT427_04365 [Pirellulales bacterium]|nr:hypothetical protein [Pirellulales bacterium]
MEKIGINHFSRPQPEVEVRLDADFLGGVWVVDRLGMKYCDVFYRPIFGRVNCDLIVSSEPQFDLPSGSDFAIRAANPR